MEAGGEPEALAFWRAFADAELFLVLEQEAQGDTLEPRVFDLSMGRMLLAFDTEERLATISDTPVPYAALPGRVVAAQLAGQELALGLNLGTGAGCETVLAAGSIDWLAQMLTQEEPEERVAQIERLAAPLLPEGLGQALRALLPLLRASRSPEQAHRAAARLEALSADNWAARRVKAYHASSATSSSLPIDPRWLMLRLVEALPEAAIVVEEALTATGALTSLLPIHDANSFYGLASGGLGFAMAGAIGISLAQPGRPVVAVVGDGSSMYSIQALWTAAHLKLPITYLVVNNRSYRIIKERLLAGRGSDKFIAMDLKQPSIDFVSVARGLGLTAQCVTDPAELDSVLKAAIAGAVPNLVEVIVDDGFGNVSG